MNGWDPPRKQNAVANSRERLGPSGVTRNGTITEIEIEDLDVEPGFAVVAMLEQKARGTLNKRRHSRI